MPATIPILLPPMKIWSFRTLIPCRLLRDNDKTHALPLPFSAWKITGKWLFIRCQEIPSPFVSKKKEKRNKVISQEAPVTNWKERVKSTAFIICFIYGYFITTQTSTLVAQPLPCCSLCEDRNQMYGCLLKLNSISQQWSACVWPGKTEV